MNNLRLLRLYRLPYCIFYSFLQYGFMLMAPFVFDPQMKLFISSIPFQYAFQIDLAVYFFETS